MRVALVTIGVTSAGVALLYLVWIAMIGGIQFALVGNTGIPMSKAVMLREIAACNIQSSAQELEVTGLTHHGYVAFARFRLDRVALTEFISDGGFRPTDGSAWTALRESYENYSPLEGGWDVRELRLPMYFVSTRGNARCREPVHHIAVEEISGLVLYYSIGD